jgi:hypothetical protein
VNERLDGKPKKSEYSGLDKSALINFQCCHNRVRDGKVKFIEWTRTRAGYIAFLEEIGPKPNDGRKWSVGRIKHTRGYRAGNVQWELHKFNSVKRRGTRHRNSTEKEVDLKAVKFKRGSIEWLAHQKRIAIEYWSDPKSHRKMSKRVKALWKRGAFANRRRAR